MSTLLRTVTRARRRRDAGAEALEAAILAACKAHTLSEVGRAAGLTKQRVWQIVSAHRR